MSQLHRILSKLEKLEEKKLRSEAKIENLRSKLKELNAEVEEIQKKLQQKEEQKKKLNLEIRALELQLKEEEEKIRKWEAQLRETTKYREQKTLMDEIAEAKKEKNKIEDQLLELIFKRDELENEIKKIKEESEKKMEVYQRKAEELKAEIINAESEHATVFNSIRNLLEDFGEKFPEIYRHYLEVMNDKRTKKPIAKVLNTTCTSCYLILSPEIEVKLYTNSSYEICPNCNAILYVDLEEIEEGE